jgi:hypothetical protein
MVQSDFRQVKATDLRQIYRAKSYHFLKMK